MNFNLFGKKKTTSATKAPPPSTSTSKPARPRGKDPASTIVTLREQLAQQDKRIALLDKRIAGSVAEAKDKMAKKDKRGAMFALKRKKMYEAEIEKIENTKITIETQVIALESAVQNKETVNAMQQANSAMKDVRKENDVEAVDDLMDNIKEELDTAAEISNAISQPVDPYAYDDDELLAELNQLEEDDLEAELLKPTPAEAAALNLPTVPDNKLPAQQEAEDEEAALKALEAEMEAMAA
uniref:Uncharacterized protein n=1 Tax=Leptocylindrus danicus TaxID=163516 RepID=A0A7S2LST0_9STRA|mmetsp:Transcript_8983/g.13373  ORF Transcript_8983/g.13373 Transcript_8983/m.13373 type:complete len:240 (+) Transcript_8983:126-845(+)|eukprot:CAMPEP_0116027112 /NCGR_PEP_ID=MMETSP0321-20121206/14403_1 /TAXON_ID=163516 /ORGANISM="Leptocylindrus danicus var. danicus, Strain B650" /LENGTH=239 /DNA_ID=CAMNT_0003500341 /DNA_START=116 /DNA_END=835 /DNA_ORIENTATION=+